MKKILLSMSLLAALIAAAWLGRMSAEQDMVPEQHPAGHGTTHESGHGMSGDMPSGMDHDLSHDTPHDAGHDPSGSGHGAAQPTTAAGRKPLYYRNPMGLPDISPVPKKDNMGMDYIPVYADGDLPTGAVRIAPERLQTTGVRTAAAGLRTLSQEVHALGVIEADERRVAAVAPRFEGWIESLAVAETGRRIQRGDVLFTAYSPELVAAQQEFLLALDADGDMGRELQQAARERLQNWQLDPREIARLERERTPRRALEFRAPATGEVIDKPATAGMRFMPGDVLYRIADLDALWLQASVYEQDMARVRPGQPVSMLIDAFPGEQFTGTIGFIYPTLDLATRTARLRVEIANADRRLRPGMFGRVDIAVPAGEAPVLAVPDAAVLDDGVRQHVLVQLGEGLFAPRPVEIGRRGEGFIEIRSGLAAGEEVVVSASFLIDAESNLRSALEGFKSGAQHEGH